MGRYQLNKNDDDKKNTYDDDETESTKMISDKSFDIYDDKYTEEFVSATIKKPLPKLKRDPHKYGDSTFWIKETRKLDTKTSKRKLDNTDINKFGDRPS